MGESRSCTRTCVPGARTSNALSRVKARDRPRPCSDADKCRGEKDGTVGRAGWPVHVTVLPVLPGASRSSAQDTASGVPSPKNRPHNLGVFRDMGSGPRSLFARFYSAVGFGTDVRF